MITITPKDFEGGGLFQALVGAPAKFFLWLLAAFTHDAARDAALEVLRTRLDALALDNKNKIGAIVTLVNELRTAVSEHDHSGVTAGSDKTGKAGTISSSAAVELMASQPFTSYTAAVYRLVCGTKAQVAGDGSDYLLLQGKKLHLDTVGTYQAPDGEYSVDLHTLSSGDNTRTLIGGAIATLVSQGILAFNKTNYSTTGLDLTSLLNGALGNGNVEEHVADAAFTVTQTQVGYDKVDFGTAGYEVKAS